MTDIVKLDVGGTVFKTSKSTLTKFDGFFRTMFETPIPITKDESGAIFIDRDPKHFRLILNFMRDGHVDLPNVSEDVKEIQKEAQYYLLEGLVELCQKHQKPDELEYPDKFRYITSDEEMFDLTYMPKKPVIVFFGPMQSDGAIPYPASVNLLEFQKNYASKIDIFIRLGNDKGWYFKGYANGRTFFKDSKYDGNIMYLEVVEEMVRKMISSRN
ncbi:hypothetical protein B9Z55_007884 [Caenorhabditis nigoni]|uniref:BTB domain-containing protein n=1 Tax=Caenorhabditis nigoni TaxID=1611254 RepID=A0A2G5VBT4_9PELO|nr:hypothetical protein B9Z55_007884 [Caenorhabditis nigoni]